MQLGQNRGGTKNRQTWTDSHFLLLLFCHGQKTRPPRWRGNRVQFSEPTQKLAVLLGSFGIGSCFCCGCSLCLLSRSFSGLRHCLGDWNAVGVYDKNTYVRQCSSSLCEVLFVQAHVWSSDTSMLSTVQSPQTHTHTDSTGIHTYRCL